MILFLLFVEPLLHGRLGMLVEKCEGFMDNLQAICRSLVDIIRVYIFLGRFKPKRMSTLNNSTKSKLWA